MSYQARALAKGITITARLLSGVRPQPADQMPYSDPAVYFANHTSHLDAVVLWSVLPVSLRARTRPVAAKDYWTSGPVRRYIAEEVLHTVLVERGGPGCGEGRTRGTDAVGEMAAAVRGGSSLILFPEGTRRQSDDRDAEVAPFRSGIFHLAAELPDTDLVPVYLENLNRILPKEEFLPVPALGQVRFGAPIRMVPGESKPEFIERARASLLKLKEDSCGHRP